MSKSFGLQWFELFGELGFDSSTRVAKYVGTVELDGAAGEVEVPGEPFYRLTTYDFIYYDIGLGVMPQIEVHGNKIKWDYPADYSGRRENCKGTLFYGFY